MRAKQLVAVALSAGLVAIGCGSDDDDGEAGASITKKEWIARANEICTRGDRELERAGEKAFAAAQKSREPDEQAEQRFLEEVVAPGIEQQVEQIAALPRPEGDEEEIKAIIAAAREGVQEVKRDAGALEEEPDPFRESTRLIKAYGVTGCD